MNHYPEGMPCWAPGAADYLASILKGDEDGWEWGGGASSIWLAPQIDSLMVMETDQEWADKILEGVGEDVCEVFVRDFTDPNYLDAVELCTPRPTLWLIDGFRRIDCLKYVEINSEISDIVVLDDALDYAEHLLSTLADIKRFAMPHPHAGEKITNPKHRLWCNTVRTHAPETKETWIWRV